MHNSQYILVLGLIMQKISASAKYKISRSACHPSHEAPDWSQCYIWESINVSSLLKDLSGPRPLCRGIHRVTGVLILMPSKRSDDQNQLAVILANEINRK